MQKAIKGDLSGVKSKVGPSDVPKEALCSISGHVAVENVNIEALGSTYEVETQEMNPIEIACAFGHAKLAKYFIEELNLRSAKHFQMKSGDSEVEMMEFITLPILKRDTAIITLLLSQSHLWSYSQYL